MLLCMQALPGQFSGQSQSSAHYPTIEMVGYVILSLRDCPGSRPIGRYTMAHRFNGGSLSTALHRNSERYSWWTLSTLRSPQVNSTPTRETAARLDTAPHLHCDPLLRHRIEAHPLGEADLAPSRHHRSSA